MNILCILILSTSILISCDSIQAQSPPARSLVTDEPRLTKGKPEKAPDYVAKTELMDGQHLALTMQNGFAALTVNTQSKQIFQNQTW